MKMLARILNNLKDHSKAQFFHFIGGGSGSYRKKLYLLIFLVASMLLFRLGSWGVMETSEARYAQISLAMSHKKNLLHPELLNIYHFHKPPVTYLITSIAYTIFQPTPFWTRFFLQIALLIQLFLVYQIGILFFNNQRIALHAAIIYVSFPLVIISTRALTTDAYLNTFCLSALYFWMVYKSNSKARYLYLFYLVIGLGFLTKGPLILVILPVVAAYNWYLPKRTANMIHKVLALSFGVLVGLSWYILLVAEDHRFIHYFLYDHTYKRLFDPNYFHRSQPFWYYLAIVPATCFPWFLILVEFTLRKSKEILRHKKWTILLIWILLPLMLFSISSSKLALYVLPIYPAIALAASWSIEYMERQLLIRWQRIQFLFQAIVILGLIGLRFMTDFTITYTLIVFFLASLFGLILLHFYWRGKLIKKMIWSGLVFIAILTESSSYILSANPSESNSTKPLTNYLTSLGLDKRQIVVYDQLTPSISFNLDKPVVTISDGNSRLERETQFQKSLDWKNYLINLKSPADSVRVRKLLNDRSVLLAKTDLTNNRKWLVDSLKNSQKMGDWTIYY